jgi:hypothetical protein
MARIRTIKPEFWTDSKTGTMSESAKCLFIGMLNHCDDFGVLEWLPVEWRAKIFPYHSLNTDGALTDLICREFLPRGLVSIFERAAGDGEIKRYVFIRNLTSISSLTGPASRCWRTGKNQTRRRLTPSGWERNSTMLLPHSWRTG